MSNKPPFSGAGNDISTDYAAGVYPATIPNNAAKFKDEILGLHSRLAGVETSGSSASPNVSMPAAINPEFGVSRNGDLLNWAPGGTNFLTANAAAFTGTFPTGLRMAPVGAHTYNYHASRWPGWMMPDTVFKDLGQEIAATPGLGGRVTFDGTIGGALTNDVATPYLAATGGDVPAMYQVLTRSTPISQFQGRSLHVRFRYSHNAALTVGNDYRVCISFVDSGGLRQTALSGTLGATTGTDPGVVLFSTADPLAVTVCPDGVIPADATSVEIGFILDASAGAFADDAWDIYEFSANIGGALPSWSPAPWAEGLLSCMAFYSQVLGPSVDGASPINSVVTGAASSPATPLQTYENALVSRIRGLGGTSITVGQMIYNWSLPWALGVPFMSISDPTGTTGVNPNSRSSTVLGALVTAQGVGYQLDTADVNWSLALTNPDSGLTTGFLGMEGAITHLSRSLAAQPLIVDTFDLLGGVLPEMRWEGELAVVVAPLNS